MGKDCFNRRGDSLGGATQIKDRVAELKRVSIAGAILWGEQQAKDCYVIEQEHVSIAGAILWGEQPHSPSPPNAPLWVSIAGAILWGEQRGLFPVWMQTWDVSIAGAILWGEQPGVSVLLPLIGWFQSQGRFSGGSNLARLLNRR